MSWFDNVSVNISNIAINTVKYADYRFIIYYISKFETKNQYLMIMCIQMIHVKEMNIKNWVHNYHFDNSAQPKKQETKNILIDEKNYEDFTNSCTSSFKSKSTKMLILHYYKLMGKNKKDEE